MPRKENKKNRKQQGGSPASTRVMGLVQPGCQQADMPKNTPPEGDLSSVKLYQTTGGARKVQKAGSPASDHVMKLVNKKQAGGSPASDHVMKFAGKPELSYAKAMDGCQSGGKPKKSQKKRSQNKKSSRKHKRQQKRGGGATDFRDTLYSRALDVRQNEQSLFQNFTTDKFMTPQELMDLPNQAQNPPFAVAQGGAGRKSRKNKRSSKGKGKSKSKGKKHSKKH